MDARGKFGEHERRSVARAESNSSFLSALQTSQVHPELDIRKAKSMKQFFYNIATTTWALKNVLLVIEYKVPTMHDKGSYWQVKNTPQLFERQFLRHVRTTRKK